MTQANDVPTADDQEKIIERIRKLLNLADKSKNNMQGETEAAFAAAQKLMAEHNLSISDVEFKKQQEEGIKEGSVEQTKAYTAQWEKDLAHVIDKLCSTKHFYRIRRSNNWTGRNVVVTFVGIQQDITLAKEIYTILQKQIKRMASKRDYSGADARHFCLGVVLTLLDRARQEFAGLTPQQVTKCKDMVVVKDALVKAYFNKLDLRTARSSGASVNPAAFDAGREAGKNVSLNFRKTIR